MNSLSPIAALAIVYLCGYVTGSLLVAPEHDRTKASLAVVRLLSGLFLSSIAFLLSLEFGLPWFVGPAAALAIALLHHRRRALLLPRLTPRWNPDNLAATLVSLIALAPPVISALRMAPGSFPPMFFNVDIPYFLEKVHSLTASQLFPPESLSVLAGRRSYHFGLHGVAALISRGSGLLPHHAVFVVLVPLLTIGIVAAAFLLAKSLAPDLPALVSVLLLVVGVPTLWHDYWSEIGPALASSASVASLTPLQGPLRNWEIWGITSNIQNLGGHFLVLASLAAIVNAPQIGWRLAATLIGSAFVFKSPAGVALMAGFAASQSYRVIAARSFTPLLPVVWAVAVFASVYGAFWILPGLPAELKLVFSPFFAAEYVYADGPAGFVADILWLVVPALVVWKARRRSPHTMPILMFALAPFIVVNLFRIVDLRGFLTNSMNQDDWRQVIMVAPVLLHAAVISVIGYDWSSMTPTLRRACLTIVAVMVLPTTLVAAYYSHLLVFDYDRGHEFADNRPIAPALAAVPVASSVIVTNDLRYPADGFRRDNLQMQIPALFGHQAFAVNYVYEAYDFSAERMTLQQLLKGAHWNPAIDAAARQYHWTHLLIRKDYPHPDGIPLERIFDNDFYSVFRF